jgi:hypothetical protein
LAVAFVVVVWVMAMAVAVMLLKCLRVCLLGPVIQRVSLLRTLLVDLRMREDL